MEQVKCFDCGAKHPDTVAKCWNCGSYKCIRADGTVETLLTDFEKKELERKNATEHQMTDKKKEEVVQIKCFDCGAKRPETVAKCWNCGSYKCIRSDGTVEVLPEPVKKEEPLPEENIAIEPEDAGDVEISDLAERVDDIESTEEGFEADMADLEERVSDLETKNEEIEETLKALRKEVILLKSKIENMES